MAAPTINSSLQNISTVAGRYVLGKEPRRPAVNVFACRLRSISTSEFVAAAPVIGLIGEAISATFGPFGTLNGQISRHVSDGFAVALDGSGRELASRIDAFRNRNWQGLADRRAEKRFMPAEPRSVILLQDGTMLPCLVVDYSASGAAVSADVRPALGDALTVGHVPARVVRLFDVGFAVHFESRQPVDEIEGLLEAPLEWRNAVAVLKPVKVDTGETGDVDRYGYD